MKCYCQTRLGGDLPLCPFRPLRATRGLASLVADTASAGCLDTDVVALKMYICKSSEALYTKQVNNEPHHMFTYKYNILYNVFLVTSKQASALKYANRHRERERGGEKDN